MCRLDKAAILNTPWVKRLHLWRYLTSSEVVLLTTLDQWSSNNFHVRVAYDSATLLLNNTIASHLIYFFSVCRFKVSVQNLQY